MTVEMTNKGVEIHLDRAGRTDAQATYTPISKLHLGSDQTNPLITDTDLVNPLPIDTAGTEFVDDCETADWTQGTDSDNETLNSTTFKQGSNSLNLGKSGTTGTTMSYSKTTTSVDFTNKKLFLWVNITTLADLVATGTAITIRLGSDSSNYYFKNFAIGTLIAGFNLLVMEQSTASTTGSPVATATDFAEIIFNTDLAADTITLGDVLMDYWHVADADDFARALDAGFPTGPNTNLQMDYRATVTSGEMNGFNINGVAFKNTDSTPTMALIGTTLVIGKDASERLTFVGKIRGRHTST